MPNPNEADASARNSMRCDTDAKAKAFSLRHDCLSGMDKAISLIIRTDQKAARPLPLHIDVYCSTIHDVMIREREPTPQSITAHYTLDADILRITIHRETGQPSGTLAAVCERIAPLVGPPECLQEFTATYRLTRPIKLRGLVKTALCGAPYFERAYAFIRYSNAFA